MGLRLLAINDDGSRTRRVTCALSYAALLWVLIALLLND